jgi:hypothetical protein
LSVGRGALFDHDDDDVDEDLEDLANEDRAAILHDAYMSVALKTVQSMIAKSVTLSESERLAKQAAAAAARRRDQEAKRQAELMAAYQRKLHAAFADHTARVEAELQALLLEYQGQVNKLGFKPPPLDTVASASAVLPGASRSGGRAVPVKDKSVALDDKSRGGKSSRTATAVGGKSSSGDVLERRYAAWLKLCESPPSPPAGELLLSTAQAMQLNMAIEAGVCTRLTVGAVLMSQAWHRCATCKVDVCATCDTVCHAGHTVTERGTGPLICQCVMNSALVAGACRVKVWPGQRQTALRVAALRANTLSMCTRTATGAEPVPQSSVKCLTCDVTVCQACVWECHQGHELDVAVATLTVVCGCATAAQNTVAVLPNGTCLACIPLVDRAAARAAQQQRKLLEAQAAASKFEAEARRQIHSHGDAQAQAKAEQFKSFSEMVADLARQAVDEVESGRLQQAAAEQEKQQKDAERTTQAIKTTANFTVAQMIVNAVATSEGVRLNPSPVQPWRPSAEDLAAAAAAAAYQAWLNALVPLPHMAYARDCDLKCG